MCIYDIEKQQNNQKNTWYQQKKKKKDYWFDLLKRNGDKTVPMSATTSSTIYAI